jgi:hypothetical protein
MGAPMPLERHREAESNGASRSVRLDVSQAIAVGC